MNCSERIYERVYNDFVCDALWKILQRWSRKISMHVRTFTLYEIKQQNLGAEEAPSDGSRVQDFRWWTDEG